MKTIRERFEEIWPVPEGVFWSPVFGAYVCAHGSPVKIECMELNVRLDAFTRCQETTDIYVSLIQEMVDELSQQEYPGDWYYRAKQIMEKKK